MSETTYPSTAIDAAVRTARATGAPALVEHPATNQFDAGENAQCCGDISIAAEPSLRYAYALGNEFVVVDVYTYVFAVDDHDYPIDSYDFDSTPATAYRTHRFVHARTISDITDEDSTEISSDAFHAPVPGPRFRTIEAAARAAREDVLSLTAHDVAVLAGL